MGTTYYELIRRCLLADAAACLPDGLAGEIKRRLERYGARTAPAPDGKEPGRGPPNPPKSQPP